VRPSWRYADPRAGLLTGSEWEVARPIICRTLGLTPDPEPVLWNTIYIEAALEQLRQTAQPVHEEDVARLSPLIYDHINLLGRYSFAIPEAVIRGELRPLHNPADDT
jgi:hypothetical protein